MKKEKKNTEKSAPLPMLDSYDNEGFMMMLEEIGAIKGEQCTGVTMLTPTASK